MDIKDLLVMAAAMRTKEEIIESLAECAHKARLGLGDNPDKELAMHCQMYLVHIMTEGNLEKAIKLTKEMEKDQTRRKMFGDENTN